MDIFSIRDVERLSGIKAHTIRIWEQRYGLIQPSRKLRNHRRYSNDDLKSLLRIVYLYNNGFKISKIAKLNTGNIDSFIQRDFDAGNTTNAFLLRLVESAMDFDADRFNDLCDHLIIQVGVENAVLRVFFPLLNRVGLLWMTSGIMPAQEHFASNIILQKMVSATDVLQKSIPNYPEKIIMMNPEGEFHELGLLFLNYLLRKAGKNTVYLGANTDMKTLSLFAGKYQPTQIHVQLVCNLQDDDPIAYLETLAANFPGTNIVASGPVVRSLPGDIPKVTLLQTDLDYRQYTHIVS